MTAPSVTMTIQPYANGKLVYLPMAPLTSSSKPKGRLMVELTLINNSGSTLTATAANFGFPTGTVAGTSIRPMMVQLDPFATVTWSMPTTSSHFLFDLATAPTTVTVSVFFAGFDDPVSITVPVGPHTGPNAIGSYRFPSKASDLALGEFWQFNGCSHDPGYHQCFAYDMNVVGIQHGSDQYSILTEGGDPFQLEAPNSDYRIFGKPVRAMADGEIIEIINDCTDNAAPLYASTKEDMNKLIEAQKPNWNTHPNGEAGNHVIIQHGDEYAMYAHLQKGTISSLLKPRTPATKTTPAIPGTLVKAGQFLGKAGNSGNSTAPHLHIHSSQPPYGTGGPRPMLFTDAWTIDNDQVMGPGAPAKLGGDPGGSWTKLNGVGIPPGDSQQGHIGDVFLLPSAVPTWPEVVHFSVEENDYQALYDAMAKKGMSPTWINTHTIEKGPLFFYTFFNVIFRPSLGADQPAVHGVDAAAFSSIKNDLEKKGYHVKQLESYFSMRHGMELFAAIFAKYGPLPPRKPAQAYHGKTFSEHQMLASSLTAGGFVPANVSVVSVHGKLSYSGLWEYRGGSTSIDLEEHLTTATLQDTFERNFKASRFQTYLKGYYHDGSTRYAAIFLSGAPNGKVRSDLRLGGFHTVLTDQRRGGKLLRSITGYQLDGDGAYGGIWQA